MNNIIQIIKSLLLPIMAGLLIVLMAAKQLPAGPPLPDDYTSEEADEYELLIEEGLLRFGENYVDLIDELEEILEEFDEFFEEFGQISIKEYEKAIINLRQTLQEEYSEESYAEMMSALDDLMGRFANLEKELEKSDSKLKRQRLRNLHALERDLEDIRELLEEEVDDAMLHYKLDAEALSEIIAKAFEDAQKALQKAKKEYEAALVIEVPRPPATPRLPDMTSLPKNEKLAQLCYQQSLNLDQFDGSLTQSSSLAVENYTIVIELENAIGGVETRIWNDSKVDAELTVGYREESKKSRSLAEEIKLVTDHSPETIRIRVIYPEDEDESVNIVSSLLRVSLPRTNPVKIKNSFGPVIVGDLSNDLTVHSSFAAIDLERIKGNVIASNTSGSVYLEEIEGRLEISNSFAPIEAVFINGATFISNSYAPVIVEKSSGTLEINTSGTVSVDRYKGNVTIHSSNGEMDIFGVTGDVIAVNSFGRMQVEEIGGKAELENANALTEINGVKGLLTISNKFAPIIVGDAGSDVIVKSSNGNVNIENIKGGANVSNRFGEVALKTVFGPVSVINANAPVMVSDVRSTVTVINQYSPVIVSAISGDVSIDNMNAPVDLIDIKGATTVNTTFGLISGENLTGPFIIGNDNGSVELVRVMHIDNDCEVTTSFGDIILQLPRAGSYNLIATTSFGEIESDLPINITSSGSISTGKYTAGKANPTIKLTGSNSTIKITTQ